MRLSVRVTPRAAADAISGFDSRGVVLIRVTAAPVNGDANGAVARLLAKTLGVPARDVVLVSGVRSRLKTFDVPLTVDEVRNRLKLR